MRIYASWTPGIFEDKDAMDALISSPLIYGIELSGGTDDPKALLQKEMRISFHTPGRKADFVLINPEFISNMQNNLHVFDNCELATFHLLSRKVELPIDPIQNCKKNLLFCCKQFGANRVAFETTVFHPDVAPIELTDPEFIKDMISETGCGIVFDISHSFVTAIRREIATKEPAREYLRRLIDASAGKVYEIHFNIPSEVNGAITDVHGIYKENDPISDAIIELTKKVIAANRNIKIFTLEMYTDTAPKEHANIMCKQAELVSKRLGIEDEVRK